LGAAGYLGIFQGNFAVVTTAHVIHVCIFKCILCLVRREY